MTGAGEFAAAASCTRAFTLECRSVGTVASGFILERINNGMGEPRRPGPYCALSAVVFYSIYYSAGKAGRPSCFSSIPSVLLSVRVFRRCARAMFDLHECPLFQDEAALALLQ